ncbi:MAG: DUF4132 domain-containing protein [Bradymonadia bacterium]
MSTKYQRNAIHELQAACTGGREIAWRWHDSGQRHPALGCVILPESPPVKDGPCKAWDAEGRLTVEGHFTANRPSGTWVRYRPSGRRESEEIHQADGTLHRRRFAPDGLRVMEEGPCTLVSEGGGHQWTPNGRWTAYPQGGPPEEVIYEQGRVVRRVGAHPVLAVWYRPEPEVARKAQKMAEVAEGRLFHALAALKEKDLLHPKPELAVALAMTAWYDQITRAHEPLMASPEAAAPLMYAQAEALLVDPERLNGGQGGRLAAVAVLCLWRLSAETLDPKFDPLVQRALAQFDRLSEGMGRVIEALERLLTSLPVERRQPLVLGAHFGALVTGQPRLMWPYTWTCPTGAVISAALDETLSWPREALNGAPSLAKAVTRTWARLAPKAVDTLTEALGRGGRAVQSPHRQLLVKALAEAETKEGGRALAGRLLDPSDRVRQVARRGLIALGDDALDPLIPLLHSRRVKTRLAAARTLGALPWSPEVARMAERRLSREDHGEVASLLEEVADPHRQPVGLLALRSARAHLDFDRWARWLGGLSRMPPDERTEHIEALLAGTAPADALQALPWVLDRVVEQASGQGVTVKGVSIQWPPTVGVPALCARLGELNAPEAPWLAAELAVRLPGRRWPVGQTLDDLAPRVGGEALAEALTWWLTRDPPADKKRLLAWLADRYPAQGAMALLEGAQDKAVGIREVARRGLIAWGEAGLPQVRALLSEAADAREVAAEVLRAVPDAESIDPLAAALARETHPRRREATASALMACRLLRGWPEDVAPEHLDVALAERAPAASVDLPLPPEGTQLCWIDDTPLSPDAQRWWLHTLSRQEHPMSLSRELTALTPHLHPTALQAMCHGLLQAYPPSIQHRWTLALHGMLGTDDHQGTLGAQLDTLLHEESADFAARAIEALQVNPTPSAVLWLDHWARHGRGSLRVRTRQAMIELASPSLSLEEPGERALVEGGHIPAGQASDTVDRLREAMCTDHRWTPTRAWALFGAGGPLRDVVEGLIFCTHGLDDTLYFRWSDGLPTDVAGRRVDPERLTTAAEIGLPHPIAFNPSDRPRWRRALAASKIKPAFDQLNRLRGLPERPTLDRARGALAAITVQATITLKTREMLNAFDDLGYLRGTPRAGGWIHEAWRPIGHHWRITFSHDGFHPTDGRSVHGRQSHLEGCAVHRAELAPADQDLAAVPPGVWCEAWADLRVILNV